MNVAQVLLGKRSPTPPDNAFAARWRLKGSHLISNVPPLAQFARYCADVGAVADKKVAVAAFDMDDTLITTRLGIKYGRGASDWKWRTDDVVPVLRERVRAGHVMVIFTNQASVSATAQLKATSKLYRNLTHKVLMVLAALERSTGIAALVFAAPGRPGKVHKIKSSEEQHAATRKPARGMWDELDKYVKGALGLDYAVDVERSFYVGDAAGRDGDHLADDRGFAESAGVRFETPEAFFGL